MPGSVLGQFGWPERQISVGDAHACVLYEAGNVKCWGNDVGDGGYSNAAKFTAVDVIGIGTVNLDVEKIEVPADGGLVHVAGTTDPGNIIQISTGDPEPYPAPQIPATVSRTSCSHLQRTFRLPSGAQSRCHDNRDSRHS